MSDSLKPDIKQELRCYTCHFNYQQKRKSKNTPPPQFTLRGVEESKQVAATVCETSFIIAFVKDDT